MAYPDLIAAAGENFFLTVADVGSIGGLNARWRPFRSIVAGALFDPREGAGSSKGIVKGTDLICPVALGAGDDETPLFITRLGNMSSTLRPNEALMARFLKKAGHTDIVGEEALKIRPLDAVAGEFGFAPDVLKVDTQGGELEVLKGASDCLAHSVIFAEIEVSFLVRYEGQPLFRDIEAYVARSGFELIDFYRLKRYRHSNRSGIGNLSLGRGQRAGRIAYGDAFFLLREDAAKARMEALSDDAKADFALKAIIILIAYGKADLAARWLDLFGGALAEKQRHAVERALRKIGRRRIGPGHFYHLFDYAARKL